MNINRQNYEEYFLLYADQELTAGQRKKVEEFISNHPDLRQELERFHALKLRQEEPFPFPGKKDLYKHKEGAAVLYRWPYAAAIALLIVTGLIAVNYFFTPSSGLVDNNDRTITDTRSLADKSPVEKMYKEIGLPTTEPGALSPPGSDLKDADTRSADTMKIDVERTIVKKADIKNEGLGNKDAHDAGVRNTDLKGINLRNAITGNKSNSVHRNIVPYPAAKEKAISGSGGEAVSRADSLYDKERALENRNITVKAIAAELYKPSESEMEVSAPVMVIPAPLFSDATPIAVNDNDPDNEAAGSEAYVQTKKGGIKSILHKASRMIDRTGEQLTNVKEVNIRLGKYEIAFQ